MYFKYILEYLYICFSQVITCAVLFWPASDMENLQ